MKHLTTTVNQTMNQKVTKHMAYASLSEYIGVPLSEQAKIHGVTIEGEDGINKGWKGLTVEHTAGITPSTDKAPNGESFDLKTVSYKLIKQASHKHAGCWVPKESMAITAFTPEDVLQNSFYESVVWAKMKSIVFCAMRWYDTHRTDGEILQVVQYDMPPNMAAACEQDYEFIRNKLKTEGFSAMQSKDGQVLQNRTKGTGHGSTTRGWYLRRKAVMKICPPIPDDMIVSFAGEPVSEEKLK